MVRSITKTAGQWNLLFPSPSIPIQNGIFSLADEKMIKNKGEETLMNKKTQSKIQINPDRQMRHSPGERLSSPWLCDKKMKLL